MVVSSLPSPYEMLILLFWLIAVGRAAGQPTCLPSWDRSASIARQAVIRIYQLDRCGKPFSKISWEKAEKVKTGNIVSLSSNNLKSQGGSMAGFGGSITEIS